MLPATDYQAEFLQRFYAILHDAAQLNEALAVCGSFTGLTANERVLPLSLNSINAWRLFDEQGQLVAVLDERGLRGDIDDEARHAMRATLGADFLALFNGSEASCYELYCFAAAKDYALKSLRQSIAADVSSNVLHASALAALQSLIDNTVSFVDSETNKTYSGLRFSPTDKRKPTLALSLAFGEMVQLGETRVHVQAPWQPGGFDGFLNSVTEGAFERVIVMMDEAGCAANYLATDAAGTLLTSSTDASARLIPQASTAGIARYILTNDQGALVELTVLGARDKTEGLTAFEREQLAESLSADAPVLLVGEIDCQAMACLVAHLSPLQNVWPIKPPSAPLSGQTRVDADWSQQRLVLSMQVGALVAPIKPLIRTELARLNVDLEQGVSEGDLSQSQLTELSGFCGDLNGCAQAINDMLQASISGSAWPAIDWQAMPNVISPALKTLLTSVSATSAVPSLLAIYHYHLAHTADEATRQVVTSAVFSVIDKATLHTYLEQCNLSQAQRRFAQLALFQTELLTTEGEPSSELVEWFYAEFLRLYQHYASDERRAQLSNADHVAHRSYFSLLKRMTNGALTGQLIAKDVNYIKNSLELSNHLARPTPTGRAVGLIVKDVADAFIAGKPAAINDDEQAIIAPFKDALDAALSEIIAADAVVLPPLEDWLTERELSDEDIIDALRQIIQVWLSVHDVIAGNEAEIKKQLQRKPAAEKDRLSQELAKLQGALSSRYLTPIRQLIVSLGQCYQGELRDFTGQKQLCSLGLDSYWQQTVGNIAPLDPAPIRELLAMLNRFIDDLPALKATHLALAKARLASLQEEGITACIDEQTANIEDSLREQLLLSTKRLPAATCSQSTPVLTLPPVLDASQRVAISQEECFQRHVARQAAIQPSDAISQQLIKEQNVLLLLRELLTGQTDVSALAGKESYASLETWLVQRLFGDMTDRQGLLPFENELKRHCPLVLGQAYFALPEAYRALAHQQFNAAKATLNAYALPEQHALLTRVVTPLTELANRRYELMHGYIERFIAASLAIYSGASDECQQTIANSLTDYFNARLTALSEEFVRAVRGAKQAVVDADLPVLITRQLRALNALDSQLQSVGIETNAGLQLARFHQMQQLDFKQLRINGGRLEMPQNIEESVAQTYAYDQQQTVIKNELERWPLPDCLVLSEQEQASQTRAKTFLENAKRHLLTADWGLAKYCSLHSYTDESGCSHRVPRRVKAQLMHIDKTLAHAGVPLPVDFRQAILVFKALGQQANSWTTGSNTKHYFSFFQTQPASPVGKAREPSAANIDTDVAVAKRQDVVDGFIERWQTRFQPLR